MGPPRQRQLEIVSVKWGEMNPTIAVREALTWVTECMGFGIVVCPLDGLLTVVTELHHHDTDSSNRIYSRIAAPSITPYLYSVFPRKSMSVLCIAAHPDDEVLGVGGTLARHAADGDDVHICILSDGVTSRYDDSDAADKEIKQRRQRAEQAADTLGATVSLHGFPYNSFDTVPLLDIVQVIETEIEEHDPDVVYTHHYGDLNIDHELACRATITATRPLADSEVDRVLAFETLSASE